MDKYIFKISEREKKELRQNYKSQFLNTFPIDYNLYEKIIDKIYSEEYYNSPDYNGVEFYVFNYFLFYKVKTILNKKLLFIFNIHPFKKELNNNIKELNNKYKEKQKQINNSKRTEDFQNIKFYSDRIRTKNKLTKTEERKIKINRIF